MYQINMYLETSIRGVRATTGWYGYILEYIDKLGNPHIIEDYDREIDITPNQLGLMAFLEALDRVNKDSEITVYSDSVPPERVYQVSAGLEDQRLEDS